MDDDRARFESEELAGIARAVGGTREYDHDLGIMVWRIPRWICPHCGHERLLPDCPQPLAYHGAASLPIDGTRRGGATERGE